MPPQAFWHVVATAPPLRRMTWSGATCRRSLSGGEKRWRDYMSSTKKPAAASVKRNPWRRFLAISIEIGQDSNNNGKPDMRVEVEALGLALPPVVVDVDVGAAVGILADALARIGVKLPGIGR
jgi:2-polyprenyl-3-methyl-5-hydroxy-6-metoxy-1,4-benzoquinol methylase